MAKPTVSSSDIEPKSLSLVNGRWAAEFSEPVILSLAVESSGIDDPYVRLRVEWGDGERTLIHEAFPVQRNFQYHHVYEEPGDYTILVTATNADSEESDVTPQTAIPVRMNQQREQSKDISKWVGLSLPSKRLAEGMEVVQDVLPVESALMGVDAKKGATQIVVLGDGEDFIGDAPVVTISQPGKKVSSARVVGRDLNVIELDRVLKDDYTANVAIVEVARSEYARGRGVPRYYPEDWFFPSSGDREMIRSAISMVLSTAPYERVMMPTFGSTLHEIPFEQMDPITEEELRGAVAGAISTWETRVEVSDVSITTSPSNNEMKMFLTLREKTDFEGTPFIVDFSLVTPGA